MYERADYVQPFNYGGVILKLGVFRPHADAFQGARDFVLLEDLKDHFDLSSTRFEREDGVALTLMRDSHLQRCVPERIPACRDLTINIVSSNGNKAPVSMEKPRVPPISARSSLRSPLTTAPHPTTSETAVKRPSTPNSATRSVAKGSPPPLLPPPPLTPPPLAEAPKLHRSSLSHVDTQAPSKAVEDRPITPRPESSSSMHHSIVINIPGGSRPRTVQDTSQMPASFESCVTNGSSRRTGATRGDKAAGVDNGSTDLPQEFTAEERHENEASVIDVLERCKGTLVRFAQILAKAEEILGTRFDFEHGNGPRLFIILPDSRRPWDSTNLLENNGFRLFYLCECGPHTKTTPAKSLPANGNDERTPYLHLPNHEGYPIRQPVQFVEKYGPYLLVMLEMLKFGHDVAGYSLPGLSAAGTLFPASAMPSTSLTLDRINKSIAYVERIAGLDTQQPWKLAQYLGNMRALDGVDLDHKMAAYLQMDGNKNPFGNLYREKAAPGRADWVCSLHQTSASGNPKDYDLESTLSSVGARVDHRLRKITLTLTSSAHANQLCNVMSRITGLKAHRLELVVDFNHTSTDLTGLEKLVEQCDIGSVALNAPSSAASSTETPEAPFPAAYPSPVPSDRRESIDSQSSHNSGGSDSRSGSVSSDPLPCGNSNLPDWMYRAHPSVESETQFNDGRRRHSIESSSYILPNDLTEAERLDAQHYMVRYCFQGNCNVRLDPNADLKILDVATGTGVWALEMARDFPKAQVYGVDMSFIATPESRNKVVPPNCHLQLANILEGLPYPDNHFDFVYQRLLVYALTPAQRKKLNAELFRVLKPEGHVQLIESDGLMYNSGPNADIVNRLSLESAMKRSVDPKDVQHMKPGLRKVGFTQINSFNIALPVGEWGGRLGQMSRDNMHGLANIWLKGDLGRYTHEECEATLVEIDKECEQLQSFYKIWLVVGQKPLPESA